jgi:hypothetical protein
MRFRIFIWCLLALVLSGHAASAGSVLIKAAEAALPPAPAATKLALTTRGITRRPNVILVSPVASVTSPFNLKLKFRAHGGSKIEPDTFRALYLKTPSVDLTGRVRPFVTANGVDMVEADAPPGRHVIEVKIADSEGRQASTILVLNVIK